MFLVATLNNKLIPLKDVHLYTIHSSLHPGFEMLQILRVKVHPLLPKPYFEKNLKSSFTCQLFSENV